MHTHASLLAYALLAAGTAFLPDESATKACKVQFDGDAFLKAASQRGLEPEFKSDDCNKVSTSDNKFYAMPVHACELVFGNATWLAEGARFGSVKGQGSFTAHVDDTGLEIRISPAGGFYLKKVTVAVTGDNASCKDVAIEDVLGSG